MKGWYRNDKKTVRGFRTSPRNRLFSNENSDDDIEKLQRDTASTEIKNLQTEVEGLKTQVGDRDKQLETLKASAGDNADLKKQIEDLQTENATAKATHESELNQLKIDFAVEKALTGAKAKNIKAVKALLELGEAKLDKDGNVKGLDEQIEKLRSGDDTKFLFEAQKQQKQQQISKVFSREHQGNRNRVRVKRSISQK